MKKMIILVIFLSFLLCSCTIQKQNEAKYEYLQWEHSGQNVYVISRCLSCPAYAKIEIPDSYNGLAVKIILDRALFNLPIESLSLSSITQIRREAFMLCDKLTTLDLCQVESIGCLAFAYCTALEEVTIPDSVKIIENEAFIGCSNLSKVYFEGEPESLGENLFDQNVIIYGVPGGFVEVYAKQYGFEFRNINE